MPTDIRNKFGGYTSAVLRGMKTGSGNIASSNDVSRKTFQQAFAASASAKVEFKRYHTNKGKCDASAPCLSTCLFNSRPRKFWWNNSLRLWMFMLFFWWIWSSLYRYVITSSLWVQNFRMRFYNFCRLIHCLFLELLRSTSALSWCSQLAMLIFCSHVPMWKLNREHVSCQLWCRNSFLASWFMGTERTYHPYQCVRYYLQWCVRTYVLLPVRCYPYEHCNHQCWRLNIEVWNV